MTQMKSWFRGVALLAIVALALPALAKPVSKSMNLAQRAKVGRTQLEAGEYRLLIDGSKVTIQRGKAILAEVEGQWEERSEKPRYDSVLLGSNGQVSEIRFAGDRRVLVLRAP